MTFTYDETTAYIVGVAIGDGNLSNSNGRAVRLRISCDDKYPLLQDRIEEALKKILPNNKVSRTYRPSSNCTDIYCYSNSLEELLGWRAKDGPKDVQNVTVPKWIFRNQNLMKFCLKGLIETDGSIYKDRKYLYVNFTTIIKDLAQDVSDIITALGYTSTTQKTLQKNGKARYVVRVCKRSEEFIKEMNLIKN